MRRTEKEQKAKPCTLVAASSLGSISIAIVGWCHAVPRSLIAILRALGTIAIACHARRPIALQQTVHLVATWSEVHTPVTCIKAVAMTLIDHSQILL